MKINEIKKNLALMRVNYDNHYQTQEMVTRFNEFLGLERLETQAPHLRERASSQVNLNSTCLFVNWGAEKGQILYASENSSQNLGKSRADLVGKNMRELIPFQVNDALFDFVDRKIEEADLEQLLGQVEPVYLLNNERQLVAFRAKIGIGFMSQTLGFFLELEKIYSQDALYLTISSQQCIVNVCENFHRIFLQHLRIDFATLQQIDLSLLIPELFPPRSQAKMSPD